MQSRYFLDQKSLSKMNETIVEWFVQRESSSLCLFPIYCLHVIGSRIALDCIIRELRVNLSPRLSTFVVLVPLFSFTVPVLLKFDLGLPLDWICLYRELLIIITIYLSPRLIYICCTLLLLIHPTFIACMIALDSLYRELGVNLSPRLLYICCTTLSSIHLLLLE